MILRHAVEADRAALASFDLGDVSSPWLAEVAEIVGGVVSWRDDPDAVDEGREVLIAENDDGEIVGVTAHTALVGDDGRVWVEHRYLVVTAVRLDFQRSGVAQLLVESLMADLARRGVRTVEWLVHPANAPSIAFSRRLLPEAEETNPPEDRPYTSFVLRP